MEPTSIYWIGDTRPASPELLGGKGFRLAELKRLRYNVPPGFVIMADGLAELFDAHARTTGASIALPDSSASDGLERQAHALRATFSEIRIPASFTDEWLTAFDSVGAQSVAVRSSGVAEDGQKQSFAGQFDSLLNVRREELIDAVRRCWASVFTARAIVYRAGAADCVGDMVRFAVVVQAMVEAKVSGVVFTAHPVTRDSQEVYVDAIWGLGEALVGGDVTPDTYRVKKSDGSTIELRHVTQDRMKGYSREGGTHWIRVPSSLAAAEKLTAPMLTELVRVCLDLERLEGCPLDIEWAATNDAIYILQSRPITR